MARRYTLSHLAPDSLRGSRAASIELQLTVSYPETLPSLNFRKTAKTDARYVLRKGPFARHGNPKGGNSKERKMSWYLSVSFQFAILAFTVISFLDQRIFLSPANAAD